MSVDIRELKKRKVSSGDYKAIFTLPPSERPAPVRKLIDTISARIKDGREANLRDYRAYWAVDLAYEAPFNQTTQTMVQQFWNVNGEGKQYTPEELNATLKSWGLKEEDLFLKIEDAKTGTIKWVPNPPVFFKIIIPIVKAYVTMRLATIYNERDRSPLLPFNPAKQTDSNRVICDIVTDIVDTISQWYGYPAYLRQAILQTLKYGIMLAFPREEWHCEKQVIDGSVEVQKEGLRYIMPHPTRMSYDLHYPAPSFNTDTGCEYAFHWNVVRAGDVLDNRMYWNRKAITIGQNWLDHPLAGNYFTEVFPCQMQYPVVDTGTMKREDKAAYYSTNTRDSALFLTTMFWKLVPSQWGLGDYKYPVWHRFDVASDDTIIWAAPCAYNPLWFMGYDFDDQSSQNSSLAFEAIPWQDHCGNLLSQMILTGKQNLKDVVFYDINMVDKGLVDSLKNYGEQRFRSTIYIPFDSLKLQRAGIEYRQPVVNPQFQYRNTQELQGMLSTALNIMERVLQFSAAETGAAAIHYQSAKEIGVASQATSQRRMYTAAGIDDGVDAWKLQLVDAAQAYMDNDVVAQVSAEIPDWERHVQELGFKVESRGRRKILVAGDKKALRRIEGFARGNLGPVQSQDPAMAQIIFQTIGVIAQNEALFAKVGTDRIVKLLERAAKLAGAPADFDITNTQAGQEQPDPQLLKQLMPILQQLQQSIMQTVSEKVAQPAAQQIAKQEQQIQGMGEVLKKLEGIFAVANAQQEKVNVMAQEAAVDAQIKQQEFEQEQRRLEEAHQAELRREAEKTALQGAIATAKAESDIENKKKVAAATAKKTESSK